MHALSHYPSHSETFALREERKPPLTSTDSSFFAQDYLLTRESSLAHPARSSFAMEGKMR